MRMLAEPALPAILPPFDETEALAEVELTEYTWNTRAPARVAQAGFHRHIEAC